MYEHTHFYFTLGNTQPIRFILNDYNNTYYINTEESNTFIIQPDNATTITAQIKTLTYVISWTENATTQTQH